MKKESHHKIKQAGLIKFQTLYYTDVIVTPVPEVIMSRCIVKTSVEISSVVW